MNNFSFPLILLILFGWTANEISGSQTLFGRREVATNEIRKIMEIYKIFYYGVHRFSKHEFLRVHKKKKPSTLLFVRKYVEDKVIEEQYKLAFLDDAEYLDHVHLIGNGLTELFAVIIVKFVALINSIQFAYGYLEMKANKENKKSKSCIRLAATLATFGSDSGNVFQEIRRVLHTKYPLANENIDRIEAQMLIVEKFVVESILIPYLKEEKMKHLSKDQWDSLTEVENAVAMMYQYLRIILFGENTIDESKNIDLHGNKNLWIKAFSFENQILSAKINKPSRLKFISYLTRILREIDLMKIGGNLEVDVQYGFTEGFILLKPTIHNNIARLPPDYQVALQFKYLTRAQIWK